MTERPILFSAPMVRAILAGKKTQTRRVVKGAPKNAERAEMQVAALTCIDAEPGSHFFRWLVPDGVSAGFTCPYGQPGDRLWVRETFAPKYFDDGRPAFRADYNRARVGDVVPEPKWKPAIHMPRALSRITLEVEGVRVERLHALTEDDARAEGVESTHSGSYILNGERVTGAPLRHSFFFLWDTINGKRASFASNPWVWVVSFKRAAAAFGEVVVGPHVPAFTTHEQLDEAFGKGSLGRAVR